MATKRRDATVAKQKAAHSQQQELSVEELKSMVQLAESGDSATAEKCKATLEKKPTVPARTRANQAISKAQQFTKYLAMSKKCGEVDYKAAVAAMAAGAGVVELCSAKPKLSLAKLMDGELADLDLGDEGLFGYAEFEAMLDHFRSMATHFLGEVRTKGEALQKEHQALQERLAAKKRKTDDQQAAHSDAKVKTEQSAAAGAASRAPSAGEAAVAAAKAAAGAGGQGAAAASELRAKARAAVGAAKAAGK
ncbi:unnamed protein product, partial [Prorocentrum cordatum]